MHKNKAIAITNQKGGLYADEKKHSKVSPLDTGGL